MNQEQQAKIDAQLAKGNRNPDAGGPRVVEVSDRPLLTPEVLERDQRKFDIVEVNLAKGAARVVETSDAPKLTSEVLTRKAKPIQTVEFVFDTEFFQVSVRHGVPFHLEIAHARLLETFSERPKAAKMLAEKQRAVKQLFAAKMISTPVFSYRGEPETYEFSDGSTPIACYPIESCSLPLLDVLYRAYLSVNDPLAPEIYQVRVRRGLPLDAALLLQETAAFYPMGDSKKKFIDMTDEEIAAYEVRETAQRRVLTASLIDDPGLSYNGEGASGAYPVENLSVGGLNALYEAYRVSNVPEAGYKALRRFPGTESIRNR